jgi:hypothetical protein
MIARAVQVFNANSFTALFIEFFGSDIEKISICNKKELSFLFFIIFSQLKTDIK